MTFLPVPSTLLYLSLWSSPVDTQFQLICDWHLFLLTSPFPTNKLLGMSYSHDVGRTSFILHCFKNDVHFTMSVTKTVMRILRTGCRKLLPLRNNTHSCYFLSHLFQVALNCFQYREISGHLGIPHIFSYLSVFSSTFSFWYSTPPCVCAYM